MTSGFNDLKSCEGMTQFLELFVLVVIVQKSCTDLMCVCGVEGGGIFGTKNKENIFKILKFEKERNGKEGKLLQEISEAL